jgi:hypothetical protein
MSDGGVVQDDESRHDAPQTIDVEVTLRRCPSESNRLGSVGR